jgi:hypothetical protein
MVIPTSKTCYFAASEDIMTKVKSQALHVTRIPTVCKTGKKKSDFFHL